MKPLNERIENLRNRHRQYNDTGQMSDALVPMVQHAKDLVAHAKELGQRVGLMMIEIDHQQRLRASCEKALENRDERVKELEEALDTLTLVVGLTPIAGNKDALQEATNNARAILNKKP